MMPPKKPSGDEPRINMQIRVPKVRLISAKGEQVGVVHIQEAIKMAEQAGLDLVEIVPNSEPPVCKVMDYGKYKYEQQKKQHEARRKQKVIQIKEIKLRPTIDKHDLEIKIRNIIGFLEEGDKVKISLKFRGREMAHQEFGMAILNRVQEALADHGKIEQMPKMEGMQAIMFVGPK